MLRIDCPFCGLRDQDEFTAWGDANRAFPALDASHAEWVSAVYDRANPRGATQEFFQHTLGCRRWLSVERNNVTHDVLAVKEARVRTITANGAAQ
jgi:methylglutamate dehydrogenase subunit B